MVISHTTAGAELLACNLDEACTELDCAALLDDFGDTLVDTREGVDFVAHYCGLDYVALLPTKTLGETKESS